MKKVMCILSISFLALVLCAGAYAAVEPLITANGMTGTVNIAAGSAVTVSVRLSPGDKAGTDADWWLVGYAFGRWYYYQLGSGLTDIGDSLDIGKLRPVYQGKLMSLPSLAILQIPQVPAGTYSLYFGTDTDMNGKVDADSLVFSEVKVISGASKALSSDLTRSMSPDVSQDDLNELITGNNTFALDFYQAISGKDGNIFFSPYSISMALAMTYAGAKNETEQQMKNTLNFTLPQDQLHSAFNALNIRLGSYAEDTFKLNVANSIWGQNDYLFLRQLSWILFQVIMVVC
ncbi:MAG: serpin family protein [Desulfobacteraceae bacterium]|nr:serpin family protein [Desulfobacteraceae bacterium]